LSMSHNYLSKRTQTLIPAASTAKGSQVQSLVEKPRFHVPDSAVQSKNNKKSGQRRLQEERDTGRKELRE